MTSHLTIKLSDGSGQPGEKVAARLRRIATLDGVLVHGEEANFRLAMGSSREMELPPGRYVVETSWRSGEIVSSDCVVYPDHVSHLDLQPVRKKRVPRPSDRDFTRASAGGMFNRSSPALDEHAYSVFASVDDSWSFVCDRHLIERHSTLSAEHQPALRSTDLTLRPMASAGRNWVMYWGLNDWMVSSLPFDCFAGGETVVLRSEPEALPFVAGIDTDAAIIADMLPSGNSDLAHRYAAGASADLSPDTVDEMVALRPLEVCAFAYAECENFEDDRWLRILAHTDIHSSWLPDISVILGWRGLMQARSDEDLIKAGELLERAVQVGVPYYSRGVKLLSEGLTLLSEMRTEHLKSAQRVKSVAAKTVATEAFTSVRV